MEEPIVTILMPVYNGEKYLKAAVDSILAQTFKDFKLLIINDGSTDSTQKIIDSYSDERIECFLQENCGVAQSLNNGLKLVVTEYIRRHDADDVSEPNMLEKQIKFLEEHPDIKFVSTRCAFMTDRGKVAYNYTQPKEHIFNNSKDFVLVSRYLFNPYSPVVHGSVLGPTAIFKEMGGYRTEFLTSEDNDLWLRIIEKYKFAVLKHSYYYLRLSSSSATMTHKSSLGFYRELCLRFTVERQQIGTDPLQRGEPMPKPEKEPQSVKLESINGKLFRADVLNFNYKVAVDAKDYVNIRKSIIISLKDGWCLSKTWRAIIYPILGKKIIETGVRLKRTIWR